MNTRLSLAVKLLLTALFFSCGTAPTSTSLPGLSSPVGELLVEDNAFPEGWVRIRDLPPDAMTDPTIRHVYRSWWGQAEGRGKAEQAIWRSHTIADAKEWYTELREGQFYVRRTPTPPDFYVEFEPPDQIDFQSQVADEFYLACGWRIWARCEVVARYRNYVVNMDWELEAEYEGHVTHGLTYSEIEVVVRAMDAKFAEALETFSTSSPDP